MKQLRSGLFLRCVLILFALMLCPRAFSSISVIANSSANYFATGYAHPITLMVTLPDDPETNQEYQKQGPFYHWYVVYESSPNLDVTLSGAYQSSTTATGTSSVAGTYTAIVRVEYYRQKRLNDGDAWIDYGADSEEITLNYKFADVAVYAWSDKYWEWRTGAHATTVAAGAMATEAHQAYIMLVAENCADSVEVPVTLSGGAGHTSDKDAKLLFGTTPISSGQSDSVITESDGTLVGVLTSSNVMNGAAIISGNESAGVDFGWSNYLEEDRWWYNPYINPNGTSDIYFYLAHNYWPMDGHPIKFYVEEVDLENGTIIYDTVGTPDDPTELDPTKHVGYYAWFDPAEAVVGEEYSGWVHVTLHFSDCTNVTWIGFRAYDECVWKN